MKKKLILMAVTGTVLAATAGVGALAYVTYTPGETNTPISTKKLSIELNDTHASVELTGVMPGDECSQKIFAQNTGDYDQYVRITLEKYWSQGEEKYMDGDVSLLNFVSNGKTIENVAEGQSTVTDTGDWFVVNEDGNSEQVTAYYKYPLASGEQTSDVIEAIKVLNIPSDKQDVYGSLKVYIDSYADAVQKIGDINAVMDEWGVTITLDGENISSITV